MTTQLPSRGEIWMVDLNPTRGHEQAGVRPALVVSVDTFNHGPAGLAVVLPITSRAKGIPLHVAIDSPEAGLRMKSFVKTEDVRSVAIERLTRRLGQVTEATMAEVEDRLHPARPLSSRVGCRGSCPPINSQNLRLGNGKRAATS